jgi:putative transposase
MRQGQRGRGCRLSTRETAALAETLTGVSLSEAAISRLTRQLDGQVAAFHRRPITFAARYLLVDGLWVSVRASAKAKRRVVLAAYGIDEHGRRELLDYVRLPVNRRPSGPAS